MKVGIITIATGKYDIFVAGLVESCENNFLPDIEKEYIIFSDSDRIKSSERVTVVPQEKLGWPYDTMMRFHMFDSQREKLSEFDYLFFMNANLKIVSHIGEDILKTEGTCGIIATVHPGVYVRFVTPDLNVGQVGRYQREIFYLNKKLYPLERREKSSFYVPFGEEFVYFQGCFNGGETEKFLSMSKILKDLMNKDLESKIIPLWHDESALNWYLNDKNPKALDPSFAYPDAGADIGNPEIDVYTRVIQDFGSPKIIQLDKSLHGGHGFLRS
jgi:hypothetical protein